MVRKWLIIAAVNGFVSVAAGAFGAHGLKETLSPQDMAIFETGARYQMYHALALLAVACLAARFPSPQLRWAGISFLVGIVVFSGSLYILVLSGNRSWGMITPIGGLALLAGWACLIAAAIRMPAQSNSGQ